MRFPFEDLGRCLHPVPTQVLALEPPEAGSIPLWILILAILAGLLFLSLLTFILYKLGFFQRKRPEDFDYQGTLQVSRAGGSMCSQRCCGKWGHGWEWLGIN